MPGPLLPSDSLASTLVFYDWEGALNQQGWLSLCRQFSELIEARPNAAEWCRVAGKFRKARPDKLARILDAGDVVAASVDELLPPFDDKNRWRSHCGFAYTADRKKVAIFSYEAKSIDEDLLTLLVRRFGDLAKITYGHAFLRPFGRGPTMYAYDLIYGLDRSIPNEFEEIQQMSRWYSERLDMVVQEKKAPFRHLTGMLRDVYPFNVLTKPHLEREVNGCGLKEWILNEPDRGRLQLVADGVWVWVVDQQRLPYIQEQLGVAGLLISRPRTSDAK